MAVPTKDLLFKPSKEDKAQTTASVARSISDAEAKARDAKTARLRKLRLQKEADQAALDAASPPAAKKTGKKKTPASDQRMRS
jgi:hypothetical protein